MPDVEPEDPIIYNHHTHRLIRPSEVDSAVAAETTEPKAPLPTFATLPPYVPTPEEASQRELEALELQARFARDPSKRRAAVPAVPATPAPEDMSVFAEPLGEVVRRHLVPRSSFHMATAFNWVGEHDVIPGRVKEMSRYLRAAGCAPCVETVAGVTTRSWRAPAVIPGPVLAGPAGVRMRYNRAIPPEHQYRDAISRAARACDELELLVDDLRQHTLRPDRGYAKDKTHKALDRARGSATRAYHILLDEATDAYPNAGFGL